MTIQKDIEKQIIDLVQSRLDELDIDGMVQKLINKPEINKLVQEMVNMMLSETIQEKAYNKIRKQAPLIDAWTDGKVQEFLYSLGVK